MKKIKKKKTYEVFISHSHLDERLAEAVKRCVSEAFGLERSKIFCTGQRVPLPMGKKNLDEITRALRQSKVVVAVMTPHSFYSPWVWFEAGGGHFNTAKKLCVTVANGTTIHCLPNPLNTWEVGELTRVGSIKKLCKALEEKLEPDWELGRINKKHVNVIQELAWPGKGEWKDLTPALVAPTLRHSPFNVFNLLDQHNPHAAKREVYLIGQHLYGLSEPDSTWGNCKGLIFDWLGAVKSRKFHLLISNNDSPANKAWELTLGPKFMEMLEKSTERLMAWFAEAKRQRLGLKLKFADFVPLGATFSDVVDDKGLMMLRPFFLAAEPAGRPEFILAREQNNRAFDYYWDKFQVMYAAAKAAD
jgi:TIR domain